MLSTIFFHTKLLSIALFRVHPMYQRCGLAVDGSLRAIKPECVPQPTSLTVDYKLCPEQKLLAPPKTEEIPHSNTNMYHDSTRLLPAASCGTTCGDAGETSRLLRAIASSALLHASISADVRL